MSYEKIFNSICKAIVKETAISEYKFHDKKKWRFDFAFPQYKLAVEIEGGVFTNGRHTRGSGFIKDMEKYNAATSLGWRILRFTPQDLQKIETFNLIKTTINTIANG